MLNAKQEEAIAKLEKLIPHRADASNPYRKIDSLHGETVCLDGDFPPEQLRSIADIVEEFQRATENAES